MINATSCGRLTLVGTPIGNLSDLSPRALEALCRNAILSPRKIRA